MACTVNLSGITYGCDDLGIGGIVKLHLAAKADVEAVATLSAANRSITAASAAASGIVEVEFNLKDGFSAFSEVKTVDAAGGFTTVPSIVVEIPKMSNDKNTALNLMSNGPKEIVAFVRTAAGTYHAVGMDFGVYIGTVDANSGTGRNEKNRYQLTITGEENELSYSFADTSTDGGEAIYKTITGQP